MSKLLLLKTESDFERFRKSRVYQGPRLRIRIVSALNQNAPRFGFIVPKKVLAHATNRNVVKRRIKSVLSKHLSKIKPVDVLFFPSAKSLKIKFNDLEKEILKLFITAGIWKS